MQQTHPSRARRMNVGNAAKICKDRGLNFTPMRQAVLEVLLGCNGPVGAYSLIPLLTDHLGKRINPQTVYRALEFLQDQGFVIRIETRNAYMPVMNCEAPHAAAYFLCDTCSTALEVELPDFDMEFSSYAERIGFDVGRRVVELQGVCAECRNAGREQRP